MKSFAVVTLVLLLFVASASGQAPSDPRPIASKMLRDGRITMPECTCSFEIPSNGEWEWLTASGTREGTAFYTGTNMADEAESPLTFDLMVTRAIPRPFVREWKSTVRKVAAAERATLDMLHIEPTTGPQWERYRYSYLQTSSEGVKRYLFGYAILAGARLIQVEQAGPWPAETPVFTAFATSFAFKAP